MGKGIAMLTPMRDWQAPDHWKKITIISSVV